MEAAFRISKYVWPHRFHIGASVCCAALIAVLSPICLTVTMPAVWVLFQGENLHQHVATQIHLTEADITARDTYIREIHKGDLDRRARTQTRQKYATQRLHRLTLARDHLLPWIPQENTSAMLCLACIFATAGVLCVSAAFIQELLVGQSVNRITDSLRRSSFRYMLSRDSTTLAAQGLAGFQRQIVDDIRIVARLLQLALVRLVRGPLLAGTCLVIALVINWRLAIFSAVVARTILFAANRLNHFIVRYTRKNQTSSASLDAVRARIRDTFSEMRSVIAFNANQHQQEQFDLISQQHSIAQSRTACRTALTDAISRLAVIVAAVAIVLPGTIMYLHQTDTVWNIQLAGGTMNGAELFALLVMQATVVISVAEIIRVWSGISELMPTLRRILTLAGEQDQAQEPDLTGFARSLASNIGFRNVTVRNSSNTQFSPPILNRINMTVGSGDVTAIVSDCETERNTLVDLLSRFAEPCDGSVTFDGFDIRGLRSEDLRSQIGLVTLEPASGAGTVADWIRFGRADLSEEAIVSAAEVTGVTDEFPEGIQTPAGDTEIPWPVSSRLRVAIARAIAGRPRILIIDLGAILSEPGTADVLQQLLPEIVLNRTVLISTPLIPPSILSSLSQVVVLEQGQIASLGTPAEFLALRPVTPSLPQTQNISRAA